MGTCVISKAVAIAYVVFTLLVILAVGLLVGLVGRPDPTVVYVPVTSTTDKPKPTTEVTTTEQVTTTDVPEGPWRDVRLPSNLVPSHYMVDLQPVLVPGADDKYWFNGTSEVVFTATEDTDYIIIQSNKLEYTHVSVRDVDGASVGIGQYWLYEANQFLIIPFNNPMPNGTEYTLRTQFVGELATDLGGLYRSSFINTAGDEVVIATTQMQPTDARKAFPCFDEPALKATFDIYLWHERPNYALSNMPSLDVEDMGSGWNRTKFNTTVKMSTYLLAFVVCDFDYVESFSARNIQTRIYARPQQVEAGNADYAKNITPIILDHFTDYFNVSYPLPKSDQIAVPDFAAGAMENWGLVIYRETALLYNPNINSASNQQRVAAVVAHELAHQWFGNLISPLWWDELWLNEGFASYVEYIGVEIVEPTWGMMEQFVVEDLHRAFGVDALTTSRPIVALNVETPYDINALFDAISYQKGACIIRMINQFTGDEAFKLGLKNYLTEYAYGPVNHYDLFAFWETAMADVGIAIPPNGFVQSMNTWTLQMGFPVVMMQREGATDNVVITQERFLLDGMADKTEPPSDYNYTWDIPFWYKLENNDSRTFMWINRDSDTYTISVPASDFFIGNYEAYGYYRVNYDDDNWQRIIVQLNSNFSVIPIKSRAQLIDDAFNLARAGDLDYATALNTTKFLRDDLEYIAWESALDVLTYFDLVLGRSKVYGVYSEYLAYLVDPVYDSLDWKNSSSLDHLQQYQQINAISVACSHGKQICIDTAIQQFHDWKNSGNNNISPNLRTVVYCQAIANGGSDEWDFVLDKYLREENSQERAKLEYALACTQTPWIIRRFLDYVLDETYIRKQDVSSVLQDLCYNEYARDITWDHIRQNWDYIYNIYGTGFFSFSGIITGCTSHFSTDFELQELLEFKEVNSDKLGSGTQSVEQAIESTNTNIQWRTDNEEAVFQWFTDFVATI